jgi:hypothetical protein
LSEVKVDSSQLAMIWRFSSAEGAEHSTQGCVGENKFPDFQLGGAEVYQEPMLDVRSAQIAEQLGDMLVGQRADGLQFDDEPLVDEKISEELTQERAVLIEHAERMLLDGGESLFAQPMGEAVFVDFLDVAVPEMAVQREAGFADLIAELEDGIFHALPFLRLLRIFAAKKVFAVRGHFPGACIPEPASGGQALNS